MRSPALDRLLAVWNRRKWLALGVSGATLAGGLTALHCLPDLYTSTATVLVDPHTTTEASYPGELETRLQSLSEVILSRSRLEGLITKFGLYPDLRRREPIENVVEQMRKDIEVELKGVDQGGTRATVAMSLSYGGREARSVAEVTNTLASFYVEGDRKIQDEKAAEAAESLRVQLDDVRRRLEGQEPGLPEGGAAYEAYSGDGGLAAVDRLSTQLRTANESRLRAAQRRDELRKQLAESAAAGGGGDRDATSARIAQLNRELAEMRRRYTDKYPDIARIKAEIAALERQAAQARPAPPAAGDPLSDVKAELAELDAEIDSLRQEEALLRSQLAGARSRVDHTPRRRLAPPRPSRDYRATRELYDTLLKKYEEARLAAGLDQRGPRFRILDTAVPADSPAAPNRTRLLFLLVLLALGLAAATVLAAEQLDTSFHTVEDLRSFTRVPVLVSIPPIVAPQDAVRRRRRQWAAAIVAALGLAVIVQASHRLTHGNEQLVLLLGGRGKS